MKIELKNIRHSPSLSEETEAFTANLYINNVHAGFAKNNGHGGNTDYSFNDERGRELIRQAEQYCEGLPPKDYPVESGMEAFSIEMNLEHFIDNLLESYLKQKDQKKIEKAMENSIVFGDPNGAISRISFKVPIQKILQNPNGASTVSDIIAKDILPELKPGEKLFNNNIPEQILKDAGLTINQYTPFIAQDKKTKQVKKPNRKI